MPWGRVLLGVGAALFFSGCERPQPETLYYAVRLEYIPSSEAPAVSEYHVDKSCLRYQRDMKTPEEGFGKPWAANPADDTWTRKSFTVRIRNGKAVDGERKAWSSSPCGLCIK